MRPEPVLDTGTALTVYRIVQEDLTNVVRHAGAGARCEVDVEVDGGGGVRVDVVDDGRGPGGSGGPAGSGHGLAGMRERAALFGGHVRAGPRQGGGFAVTARLPGRAAPAGPSSAADEEHASTTCG